jgi:hypothetical protein
MAVTCDEHKVEMVQYLVDYNTVNFNVTATLDWEYRTPATHN